VAQACTVHKSVGTTAQRIVVDLVPAIPNNPYNLLIAYVALTRPRSGFDLLIARDFDEEILKGDLPADLLVDIERVERIAAETLVRETVPPGSRLPCNKDYLRAMENLYQSLPE